MSSDYWPAHAHVLTIPLGEGFWADAWSHVARASAADADLTVIGHAHWALAELSLHAADAARARAQALALPRMAAVDDWLNAAVIEHGQALITPLQRQLLVQEALAQLTDSALAEVSEAARGALARRLTELIDALDVAQFPLGSAARALANQTAAEPFATRELAMASAVAQALADLPGAVQQQLKALRLLSASHQGALMLIAPDRRAWPLMRAIARVWQGSVEVVIAQWREHESDAAASPAALNALAALAARLRVVEAPHLDGHAQSAAQAVVTLLGANPAGRIHVAALDRRAARRMRALLERAGIAVADASGWRLSTTAGAAVIMRFADIVQREELADMLDWAKLPAVAGSAMGLEAGTLGWFEQWARARGIIRGLASCAFRLKAMALDDPLEARARDAALAWVEQLQRTTRYLRQAVAVRGHAQRFIEVLAPVLSALRADAAGAQIENVLRALSFETAPQAVDFNAFCAVLANWLEETFFVSVQQSAQVMLLPLNAVAWRKADHVMILGAQQGLWPVPPPAQAVLSHAQHRMLGLAPHDSGADALQVLLARDVPITCILTRAQPDSKFDASPWLESLRTACRRNYIELDWQEWAPHFTDTAFNPATMPAPRAPFVPARLSASALQAMLACPYQFFALRLLSLAPLEALDDMPDRQDFGILAHDWVKALHEAGVFGLASEAQAHAAALDHLRTKVARFRKDQAHAAQFAAFEALLMRIVPSLVRWGRKAAEQGADIQAELPVEREWRHQSAAIVLHGRLDRVERTRSEAVGQAQHVIDFKTAAKSSLDQRIRQPWHFPQLLIYGWLLDANNVQTALSAGYVALSGEEISEVRARPEYSEHVHALGEALDQALAGLVAGTPLPAHGDVRACATCAAAGVCRKGQWA